MKKALPSFLSNPVSKLAYTQLMPMEWRTLVNLERIKAESGLDVGLEELAFCCDIRSHGSERYYFRVKNKSDNLVLKFTAQDRGWKSRFFYVRSYSLEDGDKRVNEWRKVSSLSKFFPKKKNTGDTVEKIWELSAESRTFKPLPVAFAVSEIEDTKEENRSSEATNIANMSFGTRSKSGFNMSDVMSNIQAKMEVKMEAGKPPMPRVEGSSSGAKLKKEVTDKKRKLEDVEVLGKAKKEGWTAKKGKEILWVYMIRLLS